MPTIVYKYGCRPPVVEAEYVREQMFRAHVYKNSLVEIERDRRDKSRALEGNYPSVDEALAKKEAAEQLVKELVDQVSKLRAKTRSRSESKQIRENLAQARFAQKQAREAWKVARKTLSENPELVAARKELWKRVSDQTKPKRSENGLHWGTGALVDDAISASAKTPLYQFGEPANPQFKRWRGEGKVGVQVHQKGENKTGLTLEEFMRGKGDAASWLYLDPVDERGYTTVNIRIGTREDRSPLMVKWPMKMHRQLPIGCIIKRAEVTKKLVGPREVWTCQITVSTPDLVKLRDEDERAPEGSGTVAIDFGWHRVQGEGLRVLIWLDERGQGGEVHLSEKDLERFEKADELQQTRKLLFNEALKKFVTSLRQLKEVPEIVRSATVRKRDKLPSSAQALAWLSDWKSQARLASLCKRWRTTGVDHKHETIVHSLEVWRYHEHHLWEYETGRRQRNSLRRRDLYRCIAARLARSYEKVIMSDSDYAQISKRRKASEKVVNDTASFNRKNAAPGEFRDLIIQAFSSRGGQHKKIHAKDFSVTCPACGSNDPAQRHSDTHSLVCLECVRYEPDLDTVMCLNLLKSDGHEKRVDTMIKQSRRSGDMFRRMRNKINSAAE